ncbi:hypothetical protein E2C01_002873 [Portunus trituberculatus]|uniref:Uncharacterized protein n=1 Tax=Portunus trituberculatus TaxID=210409 RepID=A0A5B7CN28_PORTR|nr:hypothetical protein [Portunus trituberculatus]
MRCRMPPGDGTSPSLSLGYGCVVRPPLLSSPLSLLPLTPRSEVSPVGVGTCWSACSCFGSARAGSQSRIHHNPFNTGHYSASSPTRGR